MTDDATLRALDIAEDNADDPEVLYHIREAAQLLYAQRVLGGDEA